MNSLKLIDTSIFTQYQLEVGCRSFIVGIYSKESDPLMHYTISLTIRQTSMTNRPLHFTIVRHDEADMTADVLLSTYDEERCFERLVSIIDSNANFLLTKED